jgi:hypothetical protein
MHYQVNQVMEINNVCCYSDEFYIFTRYIMKYCKIFFYFNIFSSVVDPDQGGQK